jgi:hypothetical protein
MSKFKVGDGVRYIGNKVYNFQGSIGLAKKGDVFKISACKCDVKESSYSVFGSYLENEGNWSYMEDEFELVPNNESYIGCKVKVTMDGEHRCNRQSNYSEIYTIKSFGYYDWGEGRELHPTLSGLPDGYTGYLNWRSLVLVEGGGLCGVSGSICEPCVPTTRPINMGQINNNKKQTIMSKVTSFVKNLTLSADEKLLRKYNLKNECGEYTSEAIDAVKLKLVSDNENYLIEIAKGLEEEENKNK